MIPTEAVQNAQSWYEEGVKRIESGSISLGITHLENPGGPEPVGPGRAFPAKLDTGHYVEKVLRPIAVSILEPLGTSWEEALDLPRQLSLL